MNPDFIFALYAFCSDYHSGQWSRGYRILSAIVSRYDPSLRDAHLYSIQGNRHKRKEENISAAAWDEWETARRYYRELKRKFAGKV